MTSGPAHRPGFPPGLLPPPAGLTRRGFLGLVAAGALAAAAGCSDDDDGASRPGTSSGSDSTATSAAPVELAVPDLPADPFTLGVASGDPTDAAVILWTRLALGRQADGPGAGGLPDEAVPVTWEVARDEAFADVVTSGTAVADPAFGHSVHVDATGLEPATWYWYRFAVGDRTSPVGRTRTLPAAGAEVDRWAFAFGSCQSWQSGFYTAYEHLAAEELDAVIFLGDYIYEGGISEDAPRQHDGDEVITLAQYRDRYALYRSDEGLQAAHARCPWIVTWDDHEVDNDYAGLSPEEGAPDVDFEARRAAGYQAYWEHMPLRLDPPTDADLRIYRSFEVGRLARFHVIDTRQYRDDQVCDDGSGLPAAPRCDDAGDPARTILGDEQRTWLTDALGAGGTTWQVLANQVVLSDLPIAGTLYNMDQWDGYTADRQAVLDAAAGGGSPLVVVTGDIHLAGVGQLTATAGDPTSAPVGAEFVGTAISSDFPTEFAGVVESAADAVPTVEYVNARDRGYCVVTLTPAEVRADFRVVSTVAEPEADVRTDASFVLGPDGIVRPAS